MSFLTSIRPVTRLSTRSVQVFRVQSTFYSQTSFRMAATLNAENISKITDAEKVITGSDEPVQDGPTAQAQKNAGQPINSQTLHDITEGEKNITGSDNPVKGGPTATAQKILTQGSQSSNQSSNATSSGSSNRTNTSGAHTGKLDSSTISKITAAEKEITGSDEPARGGPTAQAQKHTGETIGSDNLHDITEGEKKITGGERVKGGPTATAQSELSKSRE